jgi:hypothetical protein
MKENLYLELAFELQKKFDASNTPMATQILLMKRLKCQIDLLFTILPVSSCIFTCLFDPKENEIVVTHIQL